MPMKTDYKVKEGARQTAALKAESQTRMLARAVKMYQDGVSVIDISRATRIGTTKLYARLAELNIPRRERHSKPLPP